MGILINLIIQKIIPATRKSIWIEFRKTNGAWTTFLLSPSKKSFIIDKITYNIEGRPEIDDFTNQRKFYFVHGVSSPLNFDKRHAELIGINKEQGNVSMALAEADELGFQKALLLKNKKGLDPLFIIAIITAITLVVCLLGFYLLFGQLDQIVQVLSAG